QLYFSDDNGNSWSKVSYTSPMMMVLSKVYQDPIKPHHIILAYKHTWIHEQSFPLHDLLKESIDGGVTWNRVTDVDLDVNGIWDFTIKDDYYYLMDPTRQGILKLRGDYYQHLPAPRIQGFENLDISPDALLFDYDDPNIVYAKGGEIWELGIMKSEDNMRTWRKMDQTIAGSSPTIIVGSPTDPNVIYTNGNIIQEAYYTEDGGQEWKPFGPVGAGDELKVDPRNPSHLFLVDEMSNAFESYQGGAYGTFNQINNHFFSGRVSDFEVNPTNPNSIYAATIGLGVSEYYEEGPGWNTWKHLSYSPDYSYDIELDPSHPEIMYAPYSPKLFENDSSIWKYNPQGMEIESLGNEVLRGDDFLDADSMETFAEIESEMSGWSKIKTFEDTKGVTSLEFDKKDGHTLYAGVIGDKGKIFVSYNDGYIWNQLNDEFTFVTIHELAADPNNEHIVYAAPWGGGLFKSTDYGYTWKELNPPTPSIISIIVDPSNSDRIILGDRNAPIIYESPNQGQNWSVLYDLDDYDPGSYYRVMSMGMHNNDIYFSVLNKVTGLISLMRKINDPLSGHTFKLSNGDLTRVGGDMTRSALNFYSDGTDIYAIAHIYGIYKLIDGKWIGISPEHDMGFNQIITNENGRIFISGGCDIDLDASRRIGDDNIVNNIYSSDNEGKEWNSVLGNNPFNSGIKKLIQHPTHKNVYYAATGTGVYYTIDMPKGFVDTNNGLNFKNIGAMSVTENYVYVGTLGGGVYVGKINPDFSISWRDSTGPYPEISNIQIKVDPTNSNVIFASSFPGGVFKSSDRGQTWAESNFALPSFKVNDPLFEGYYSLDIDPIKSNNVYLGIYSKGIYKSTDGGAVWIPMYGSMGQNAYLMQKGIKHVKVDPKHNNIIYVVSDDGVDVSYDFGNNWEDMSAGLVTRDLLKIKVIYEGERRHLYVGSNGYGLYKFNEYSNLWENLGRSNSGGFWAPWERRMYQFISILFDPDIDGRIYWGSFPSGVFISEDDGESWYESNAGVGNDGIFSLTMHPHNHDIIWAGTYNGVFKSSDRGTTWERKDNGFPSEQWPYVVAIDSDNPNIMYSTTKNGQNKGFCERNEFCGVVMKTTDGGENWFKIMDGLNDRNEFYNLIIYPYDHNILFMSTNGHVYMSTTGGESVGGEPGWTSIQYDLPQEWNQVRDNVADNLILTSDNRNLILGLKGHGCWKLDLEKVGLPG
ncbi:hypothetical protein ACFLZX_02130, partial [Nanoarchaeota archaeon]